MTTSSQSKDEEQPRLRLCTFTFILHPRPDGCSPFLRMFGMVLEKIIIPEIQKVSGNIEKKICAVGITKILTECPAMMDTEYTKLW